MKKRCVHYWVISPPQGPTSVGICHVCGESREFPNVLQYDQESKGWGGKQTETSKQRDLQPVT